MKQTTYVRAQYPDAKVTIFFIDIRATDRLEDFYRKVKEDQNVQFFKGKVAKITEDGATGNVVASLFSLSPYAVQVGGKPHAALRFKGAGPVYVAGNAVRGVTKPLIAGTAEAPIAAPPVTTFPVGEMEKLVRARAGCLPRDAIDSAYVTTLSGWKVSETEPLRLRVGAPPR